MLGGLIVAHHNFGKRYETISIIAWVLNRGSIPLYDYSWGEGSPPLYIYEFEAVSSFIILQRSRLVYNGRVCGGIGDRKPNPLR